MKIRYLLSESSEIDKGGEKQNLVDPYDSLHTAQVADWITVPLDKFAQFSQSNNLKFFNSDEVPELDKKQRGAYKLSINAIPLNEKRDNDEFVHIIKTKITGRGKNDNDSRDFIYYFSYGNKPEFNSSFKGTNRYPVERVDQLPIYATNTGIGSNKSSERDYWKYLSPDEGSTKGQDTLNPRDFPKLKKNSFIDTHGSTGYTGSISPEERRGRKAELGVPDDEISDTERQTYLDNKAKEIEKQNAAIINAITAKKITAGEMVKIIKNSKGSAGSYRSQKAMGYLADLTKDFTATPNSPGSIYPLQLAESVSGLELMRETGIQGLNSIAVDFMEVLHPVILLYGNCNGNASRMAESFFDAPQEELIKNATISYTRDSGYPLIDSAIFYKSDNDRGFKRLGISTKQQGSGGGAGGSKFPSLQVAWREVEAIAGDKWTDQVAPLINKNVRYKLAWEALRNKMAVTRNDAVYPKLINDIAKEFSMDSTEPTEVFMAIANSKEFKQLVIWIFNHSATIQIDTRADYGDSDRDRPGVISNIVATWPTQLASTVEVSEDGDSIKLIVNGVAHDFTPELGDRTDVEYGATGDAEDRYRPGDYADDKGNVALNKLQRYGGGTNTVNYGRSTSKTVNPATFTTKPLSSIGKINRSDGAVRYSLIRLARLKAANFQYLPYEKFVRWVQTNQLDEARGSASAQAQSTATEMNNSYKNLLSRHGTSLDDTAISKFPISTNVDAIDAFSKNLAFIAKGGRVDYNPAFIEALKSISSPSTGDPKTSTAVEEFIKTGQADPKLLNALEAEALSTSNGEQISPIVTKYLNDYTQKAVAAQPKQPAVSPEEQRIQRIIAIARQDGRAKDETLARQEIADFGDAGTDEEIANELTETRSRILRGILSR